MPQVRQLACAEPGLEPGPLVFIPVIQKVTGGGGEALLVGEGFGP